MGVTGEPYGFSIHGRICLLPNPAIGRCAPDCQIASCQIARLDRAPFCVAASVLYLPAYSTEYGEDASAEAASY